MPNINVPLSTDNHARIKLLAKRHGGIGGAILALLRAYEGHPEPTAERFEWTERMLKAVHAGANADEWISQNPPPAEPERLDLTAMLHGGEA